MITATMYATQWYPTMFSIALPFEYTIRIWDLVMVEGFRILYRAAFTLLKLLQKEFMKEEFEGIMERLHHIRKYITVSPDEFIALMMESNITPKKITKLEKDFNAGRA